jgi:hypothetical protein
MRRNNSEIPQPQTLVADTRAPIATWTGPWTCEVWFQSAGRKNFHVIRVHTHREKVYPGLCENPGVWGANPASKEKVSSQVPSSSVQIAKFAMAAAALCPLSGLSLWNARMRAHAQCPLHGL